MQSKKKEEYENEEDIQNQISDLTKERKIKSLEKFDTKLIISSRKARNENFFCFI